MIELSRTLLRQFRAVVRKSVLAAHKQGPSPLVACRAGRQGLTLSCQQGKVCVRHHTPGSYPADSVSVPFAVLTKLQNAGTVVALEQVTPFKAKATWQANEGSEVLEFDTADPSTLLAAPDPARNAARLEPQFLQALDDAARTASRDHVRYACNLILLRGKDGAVIGTDGRQLLIHKGFPLPWQEEQFLPALPVFGGRELPRDQEVMLGQAAEHITLEVGPWLLAFQVEKDVRFPDVDGAIPRIRAGHTRLHLGVSDVERLIEVLGELPADESNYQPVTLDLGEAVVLRFRREQGDTYQVALDESRKEGPALQVVSDHRYLLRALGMCFTEMAIVSPDAPLVCKDARRTYLWMPLPLDDAVPAAAGARAEAPRSSRPTTPSYPEPPTRTTSMPVNEPRNNGEHANGNADQSEPLDAVREAEELRAALQATLTRTNRLIAALRQQRRTSRVVETALASLRRLQP